MKQHEIATEIAKTLSWDVDATLEEVKAEAADPGSHVRSAWLEVDPSNDAQIEHFYSSTQTYVYELMSEAYSGVRQAWRDAVISAINEFWGHAPQARVLDYGAGVGTDTLYFAEQCRAAYYYDLPGFTREFAAKRFGRHKVPITSITTTSAYDAEFDAVVAFDVLEHLVDPLAQLDEMVRLTKYGGMLFVTESFDQTGSSFPLHLARHSPLAGKLDALMAERGCRPVTVLEGRIHAYSKGPSVSQWFRSTMRMIT